MSLTIPFNDTSRLFAAHREELLTSLQTTANSGYWLVGENTAKFAQQFAEYCGSQFCLPVANGTDALEIALRAVLAQHSNPLQQNEVITVANAGGYASTACRLVGATPVYVDIDASTQLISLDSLTCCMGPNVKAIIITHLYGAGVDIPRIRQYLHRHGYGHIPIIEDCAQAHGAKVGEQRVGSLGDLATFSFYPTKNLGACGDAGAITCSDEGLFDQLKCLHQYGWRDKYCIETNGGRNSRMDELQAGILTILLNYLDENNCRRYQIWERYRQAASSSITFLDYKENDFVGHLAVAKTLDRDRFIRHMQSKNIAVDIHYPLLDFDQVAWKNLPMRLDQTSQLKVSKQSSKEIISIPCFPYLNEAEIDKICLALTEWE